LSEVRDALRPAIGLLELGSIAAGIVAGDAMVKASPVSALHAGTVHPGRYLVLVGGDTAAVEVALEAAPSTAIVDSLFLADVHPDVVDALAATGPADPMPGVALGIVETSTSAAAIVAADAGVKAAAVRLLALRLADDLGGKAYCLFGGDVADVEAAVDTARERIAGGGRLVASEVIAQLHAEMADNLATDLRFHDRLRRGGP
jgi:microcompartment protein CcmL/EutN